MRQPNQPVGEAHPATIAKALRETRKRAAAREELLRTQEALEAHYAEILARESIKNPLVWGRYATVTQDEQDKLHPFKPFPSWEYFDYLLPIFQNEPVVFLKKSRTMLASWFVSLWALHEMLNHPATSVVIQSRDEDRAVHNIESMKILYENSIPQLKDRWPLSGPLHKQSYNRFDLANKSWAVGISGDPKKINSLHSSIVILDEAALMERGAESFASALATKARTIIVLSSAEPGWFEDYIEGARPTPWPQYAIDAFEEYKRTRKTLFPVEHEAILTPERAFNHDPLTWSRNHSRVSLMPEPPSPSEQMAAGAKPKTDDDPVMIDRRVSTFAFKESRLAWKPAAGMNYPMQGIQFSRTKAGVGVIHLHYSAREDMRTDAQVEKLRWRFSNLHFWVKEFEMQARALAGALVYPDFDEAIHVVDDSMVPRVGTRYCAVDPHPRNPHFFLWVLIDRFSDWWVYRELWPSITYGKETKLHDTDDENSYTIKEYCETVAYLEGNKLEFHNAETDHEYAVYQRQKGGENIVTRFMDQAAKGFSTASSDGQRGGESYWDRYDKYGLMCLDPYKRHSAGEDAIRDLLKLRKHDVRGMWPRLHIARSCTELILEMKRHKYQRTVRSSDERELKQRPAEARSHGIDCLRYLATSEISYIRSLES
jgi:hypothetical protein